MAKFNVGDIVKINAPKGVSYEELDGMLFEVLEGDGTIVSIDVTGLYKVTKAKYGWPTGDGRQGWYVDNPDLELVSAKAPATVEQEKQEKPKRTTPLPKTALSKQCRELLELLEAKGSVTALEASGVYRIRALPRRIADLKEAGYRIVTSLQKDTTGQRYARYYLRGQVDAKIAA